VTADDATLRVGHAERQRAIEILESAYADGRLDHAELEQRAERALTARIAAHLDPLLADLGAVTAGQASPAPWNPPLPAGRPPRGGAGQLMRLVRCVLCCGK
jgi:DUF1707 SHOCT-like domain